MESLCSIHYSCGEQRSKEIKVFRLVGYMTSRCFSGVLDLLKLMYRLIAKKNADTLHRFWKKEHDWGWKKFMELTKIHDGFLDADTLIIKAQVQVIRYSI